MSRLTRLAHRRGAIARTARALQKTGWPGIPGLRHPGALRAIAVAIEFLSVNVAAYLAVLIYHLLLRMPYITVGQSKYLGSSLFLSTAILLLSITLGHFQAFQTRSLQRVLTEAIGTVALAFSFLLSMFFLLKLTGDYSRGAFIFQLLGVGLVVLGGRTIFLFQLRSAAREHLVARRVVLIGNAVRCTDLAKRLKPSGIQVVKALTPPSFIDENQEVRLFVDACRLSNVSDILILADGYDWSKLVDVVNLLSELPLGLHVVPSRREDFFSTSQILNFGNITTIQVARPPLTTVDRAVKRAFDLFCAVAGLILLSPLFLMAALAIKLDSPGPIFFQQLRHGYNKVPIWVLKFRSMNVLENSSEFIKQAQRNDSRVTRVGRILRRTNIDELPQLLNVLRGEMSIVGPRPHATAHDKIFEELIPPYSRRHRIKPGISGWAQVNGFRGETDTIEKMQRRLEYDLHYIENWSLWFDLKIVLMTLFSREAWRNAY